MPCSWYPAAGPKKWECLSLAIKASSDGTFDPEHHKAAAQLRTALQYFATASTEAGFSLAVTSGTKRQAS